MVPVIEDIFKINPLAIAPTGRDRGFVHEEQFSHEGAVFSERLQRIAEPLAGTREHIEGKQLDPPTLQAGGRSPDGVVAGAPSETDLYNTNAPL